MQETKARPCAHFLYCGQYLTTSSVLRSETSLLTVLFFIKTVCRDFYQPIVCLGSRHGSLAVVTPNLSGDLCYISITLVSCNPSRSDLNSRFYHMHRTNRLERTLLRMWNFHWMFLHLCAMMSTRAWVELGLSYYTMIKPV